MTDGGLLDDGYVRQRITGGDRWCSGHGATPDGSQLGAGIIYYALAYALPATTCVCIGSGGGFVPRLMRQAQRDLGLDGARTILIDGADAVSDERKFWGSPDWTAPDHFFRREFPDVEIMFELSSDACEQLRASATTIDYLHIDADHHYDGAKADWDNFSTLVTADGVVTMHDTANSVPPCGVPQVVAEICDLGDWQVIDLPISYGTAILKRTPR
jgi:hypothetical protein